MLMGTYILEILHYSRLEVYLEHFILYNIQNLSKQHQDFKMKKFPYFLQEYEEITCFFDF
jgi:hypothetical protein